MRPILRMLVTAIVLVGLARSSEAAPPETVMITLHAKPGAEDAIAGVLARHYNTAVRLGLIGADSPHMTLRTAGDRGGADFVEILTWLDADMPDSPPQDIDTIWREMNRLVESRGGRPGIDIATMIPVPGR